MIDRNLHFMKEEQMARFVVCGMNTCFVSMNSIPFKRYQAKGQEVMTFMWRFLCVSVVVVNG